MSTKNDTPERLQDNQQEPVEQTDDQQSDPPVDEAQGNDEAQENDKASESREAAKYRTRLRDTEAERDTLQGQLTEARRQIVESMSGLHRPEALWAAGTDLDTLIDDQGRIDPTAVREAVAAASDSLGLERRPTGPYSSAFGSVTGEPVKPKQDFSTAFMPEPK